MALPGNYGRAKGGPKKAGPPLSDFGRLRLPNLRRRLDFPLAAPDWPASVPRPPERSALGVNYNTDWARTYPVRLARAAYTELVTRPVVSAITRPRTEGLDRFDFVEGPVIFAANHTSHLDAPLVLAVLPDRWKHRLVTISAADYFFTSRAKAIYFSFALNAVPIERAKVNRKSAERASALVSEGWNLLIFPEGGRSPDGWGQEHRGGAAWLAARTGRPIVPVNVNGTGRLWPRGSRRIYTGETAVTFGAPIYPDVPARALVGIVERAIAELADEATGDWWSARVRAARSGTPSLTGPEGSPWRRAWALGPSPKDSARCPGPAGQRRWPPRDGRKPR